MRFFRSRFIVFGGAVLLILLHVVGALDPLERVLTAAVRPVQRQLVAWLPLNPERHSGDSEQRLRELESQISRLMTENIQLKEERSEKAAIDRQQSFLERRSLNGTTVAVIGRSLEGDDQILLLDRGKEAGLTEGQPVITEEGILVGTILQAETGRSAALLVTDPRSSIAAEVENAQRSPGLIEGRHGLTMTMELIPQNELLEQGQAVVTSAVDVRIPANLPIGIISDIQFQTGDLFQRASLRPLVELRRIRYVTVITSS